MGKINGWAARLRLASDRLRGPVPAGGMLAATLLVLTALSVWGALRLAEGSERRAFEQILKDAETSLSDTSLVAQSFVSSRDNLSRVDVELSQFAGIDAPLQYRLLQGDGPNGPVLYAGNSIVPSFEDNPFLTLRFPAISESGGQTYTLVMETPEQPLAANAGIQYSTHDAFTAGQMYTSDGPEDGDLVFTLYYEYELATLLSDFAVALTGDAALVICWVLLLLLPGLALLYALPNGLTAGQRLLAAPGVGLLALPVFYLVTSSIGLGVGGPVLWLVFLMCAAYLAVTLHRSGRRPAWLNRGDALFWGALAIVLVLTLAGRLLASRDLLGGMGLDAYHHTLIAGLFLDQGGIPSSYEPYAPLASYTYHFGFHSLVASLAWLSGRDSPFDVMGLVPLVGQVTTGLVVLTLTLYGWRVVGNRWAGLIAGGLAGLVSIVPAFYVNWSRNTQGLGLVILPVALVLFIEAVRSRRSKEQVEGKPANARVLPWHHVRAMSGPVMLAVIGAVGLALTHYRMAMIYSAFAVLFLGLELYRLTRAKSTPADVRSAALRAISVGVLSIAAMSPWLLNLAQNFTVQFVSQREPVMSEYYDLRKTLGPVIIDHYSVKLVGALALLGLFFAARKRVWAPVLPAVVWLLLGLVSNPYLLPFRAPYAGYLDVTTLASGAWLPGCLLAGYGLAEGGAWLLSQAASLPPMVQRAWRAGAVALSLSALVLAGGGSALSLAEHIDARPYIAPADVAAARWMRDNLDSDAYVLANPFAFPWDPPPQSVHGSDAGLWMPYLAGVRASVPPIPAYNEKPLDPNYISQLRGLVAISPFPGRVPDWEGLKAAGVTHIYVGSRGGALSVEMLLESGNVEPVFHQDGVWIFELN